MRRQELKYYLRIYPLIRDKLDQKQMYINVYIYKRKKQIYVPSWVYLLEKILEMITTKDNKITSSIIKMLYFENLSDKNIILKLPISESSYYREKKRIEDKIFELFILFRYVSKDEILEK